MLVSRDHSHPLTTWRSSLTRIVWREITARYCLDASKEPSPNAARQAVSWLLHAHQQSGNDGVPAWYDLKRARWAPSYPETTGYLIPTLLTYSQRTQDDQIRTRAFCMADYLLRVQTPEGAIPGPGAQPAGKPPVYIFDTGQVVQGWFAAWEATGDTRYEKAAIRAGDWLVENQDGDGAWRRYQFGDQPKSYDARVAWILVEAGQKLGQARWVEAGRKSLQWVTNLQQSDGWFPNCWLERHEPVVSHTIAYAVEGLLEAGLLLKEERFVMAARLTGDALLARQRYDGHLGSDWGEGWRSLPQATCLTGDAQMARCWFRLYRVTGEVKYREAGRRALTAVTSAQLPADLPPDLAGAIPGSRPIWDRYLSWRLPNWASKFFLDAWLEWQEIQNSGETRIPDSRAVSVKEYPYPPVMILVLNWNNAPDTLECLASLERQTYPSMQVLVVDNGSTDNSVEVIRANFPQIQILETGCNLGYAGGNNVGIREALVRGTRFVFLLNNDVTVAPDAVAEMVRTMQEHPRAGLASPMILAYSQPQRIWFLGGKVDLAKPMVYRLHDGELDDGRVRSSETMDMATGSALFIRREVLDKVGLMDEAFFLYYEETDWCLKVRKAGYEIITIPTARAWHKVSASLNPTSPIITYYMTRNGLRFLARALPLRERMGPIVRLLGRSLWQAVADARRGKRMHSKARLRGLVDYLLGNFGPGEL